MREIKFRGKRINNGEWVYGYLIGNDVIVGDIVEFSDEYFNTEFWYKVDPKTVGQYTGLKDRNGQEIYEGDILRDQESYDEIYYYKVIWHEANACFYFKDCFGDYECFQGEDLYLNQIEVIGNIYENPELPEVPHE